MSKCKKNKYSISFARNQQRIRTSAIFNMRFLSWLIVSLLTRLFFKIHINIYVCVCVYIYIFFFFFSHIQEGHSNPLQYSCLEKPMDRGAHRLQSIGSYRIRHNLARTCSQMQTSQVALVVKNPPANAGDILEASSIPGLVRSSGRGHSNPLQYSCLENSMDRGAWQATVHGVAKSWTLLKRLSMHTHSHMHIYLYR